MGISVVICTKNEEKNIGRCLLSVQEIADEIIIVDSHSTDKTPSICQSFPKVRFYTSDWMGYSRTKNYANSLASHNYILSLDADEELSVETIKSIQKLGNSFKGLYNINRMTNYCGTWIKHSGWFPDRHIRLFPKQSAQWVGDVHETLKFNESLPVINLDGVVYHYSYYSIDEHWHRINVYSKIGAEKYTQYSNIRLILSMTLNSKMRFLRHFVVKRGFLDGFSGFVIATLSAAAVFFKYAKAYQIKNKKS